MAQIDTRARDQLVARYAPYMRGLLDLTAYPQLTEFLRAFAAPFAPWMAAAYERSE